METNGINRQMLGVDVLGLPGLMLLGHSLTSRASTPMQPHTHAGAMEFVVALKGSECYFAGGERYPISGGDVFVSFADEPHGNGGVPQGVSEFIWFQVDPRPSDLLGLSCERAERLRALLQAVDSHMLKADRECLALLRKSLDAFLKQDGPSSLYAAGLFSAFLFRLLSLRQIGASRDARLDRALGHIDGNLGSVIALDTLAGLSGMSLSAFKRSFKEYTGRTPRDFINHRKVEMAREYMRNGRSVTETAMELGFSSSEYFAVVFKKYTASAPSGFAGRQHAGAAGSP